MKVALIIPCRNEEQYIEKCILSIVQSNYPQELLTVYVCDGMSDDNTRSIIKKLSEKYTQVVLLDNLKKTTPFALNLGLKKSDADIKIILGAHSEIDKDFITENVNAFKIDKDIGCAGGIIENVYENETSKIIGMAMSSSFGVGNAHFRTGNKDGFVDTVAFGAYKKEVFEEIGYFDETLTRNQDDEFNYRVIKNNFKIYLSHKIKCKYYVRGTFEKLFKQYYQYGYWKVFVNKKHKAVTTLRQLIPLFFVLFLLTGGIISFFNKYLFYGFISILGVYFIIAIIASLKFKITIANRFKIIYTFLILHLSYGLGYFNGIIDFILLNKNPTKKNTQLTR